MELTFANLLYDKSLEPIRGTTQSDSRKNSYPGMAALKEKLKGKEYVIRYSADGDPAFGGISDVADSTPVFAIIRVGDGDGGVFRMVEVDHQSVGSGSWNVRKDVFENVAPMSADEINAKIAERMEVQ